jgi:CheY-like chemotaxis protein
MEKKKILIVDDVLAGRQLLQAVLLTGGYETFLAETGEEAIEIAGNVLPDLILLDVMMPETDGYEVARRLKTDDKLKNIPIIFVSALDDRDSKMQGLNSGAEDYVSKPYDRIEILDKIKKLLKI